MHRVRFGEWTLAPPPGPAGLLLWLAGILAVVAPVVVRAQSKDRQRSVVAEAGRCIALELYVRGDDEAGSAAKAALNDFLSEREGIRFRTYKIDDDEAGKRRLTKICGHFKIEEETPLLYGCGRPVVGFKDRASFRRSLRQLLTITAYVRSGCPHCAEAKRYLPRLLQTYAGFELSLKDVVANAEFSREMQEVVQKHRVAAASLPVVHVCDEVVVGFDRAETTGKRIEAILQRWTKDCTARKQSRAMESKGNAPVGRSPVFVGRAGIGHEQSPFPFVATNRGGARFSRPAARLVAYYSTDEEDFEPTNEEAAPPLDEDDLPLPGEDSTADGPSQTEEAKETSITLPILGEVNVDRIGMPLFTLAVGLVDGFNPCAMWVLLFLLSVLVNLKSRWKVFSVAGTFVLVSGAAYFAFMAAWLNVFLLLGVLTWVRVTLATLAIVMGTVHVKDFFAFKKGITFSIPESTKPGIYARVRRIVTAENLKGAILGAAVLAVLVNVIELLCTAGLPALYAQILSAQQLPAWQNYAYLFLYILAYMLDDALMVGLVIVTLDRHKLQETHGRWLKMASGTAILVLGILMLARPEWLGMS